MGRAGEMVEGSLKETALSLPLEGGPTGEFAWGRN